MSNLFGHGKNNLVMMIILVMKFAKYGVQQFWCVNMFGTQP